MWCDPDVEALFFHEVVHLLREPHCRYLMRVVLVLIVLVRVTTVHEVSYVIRHLFLRFLSDIEAHVIGFVCAGFEVIIDEYHIHKWHVDV